MKPSPSQVPHDIADKVILQGIHLTLTDAFRRVAIEKAERLIRHSSEIIRIRIDIEREPTASVADRFVAKGQIEIRGPDLLASVVTADPYQSLDGLMDKFDKLLRRRHEQRKEQRNHPQAVELGAPLPKTK